MMRRSALAAGAAILIAATLAVTARAAEPHGFEALVLRPGDAGVTDAAGIIPVAKRQHAREPEDAGSVSGRYAVMRDRRDTGCMLTLDTARVRDGARAQLAPGCRDQGIVIFDPTAWKLVGGALVLTARAGHKTRLDNAGEGLWIKDAKEGGKPLGLKHL